MTIEEMFKRGEISIRTRNICINNQLKTFRDLELHYIGNKTFRNLRSCGNKANDELIEVYNEYKHIYSENKTAEPDSIIKSEVNFYNLDSVVTDLDEVIKTNLANATLEELEQRLKNHWGEKAIVNDTIEPSESAASNSQEELEQKLQKHWMGNASKEAPENKNIVSSVKTVYNVTGVVDLEKIEHTLNQYRNEKTTPDTINSDEIDELEQKLQNYWRKQASEVTTEDENPVSSVKSTSESTDTTNIEKLE